jgi:branched-chain amino acid transport system permease protein
MHLATAFTTPSRAVIAAVLAAAVAALPFTPWASPYILSIGVRALLFIMLGQAWNIIAGYGGQLSLGHGVFFGVGAYGTALLFNEAGVTPWVAMFIVAALAVVLAIIVGVSTMRSRGVFFALATIVISLGFEKTARFLVNITGGDAGLAVRFLGDAAWAMQFRTPAAFLWIDLAVVLLYYWISVWLIDSKFGLQLQAVRDDEEAAAASGVNVLAVKLTGLSLSAAMTAVAGTLYVQFYLSIDPGTAFGLFQGIQIQLPALIGGIGTPVGPIIGGAIAIVLSEGTNLFATRIGLEGIDVFVYGLVLLLVVLYAPQGVLRLIRRSTSDGRGRP